MVCCGWAACLAQPSVVWSTVSIRLPARRGVHSWVTLRGVAVQQLEIGHNYLVEKLAWPAQRQFEWEEESKQICVEPQLKELLQQATELKNLNSLKLMLTEHCNDIVTTAHTINLATVWHQICMLSQLQTLTVLDHRASEQLAAGLWMLRELTTLTSLHLQRGYSGPSRSNPSDFSPPLPADFDDLCELLRQLPLQHLTLAFMHFDTYLDAFWEFIGQRDLTYLRLEYITLHEFDYFDIRMRSPPAEMPATVADLMNLR